MPPRLSLILEACESFDFGQFRHESDQALTDRHIATSRISGLSLFSKVPI